MRSYFIVIPLGALVACGGSGSTIGNGTDGGGIDSGASDSAARADTSTGNDSGRGSDSASDSSAPDTALPDGPAPPCPDVAGAYSVMAAGQGCGDLSTSAAQCITQTSCHLMLVSGTAGGGAAAVNGLTQLDMSGAFMGAALQFGTVQRTGCTGQWDPIMQALTVDCGGMGTSQSCIVTLTRTGNTCP